MPESCPLQGMKSNSSIPTVCLEQCEVLWEWAVFNNVVDGEYDVIHSNPADCAVHEYSDLVGSDIFLQRSQLEDTPNRSFTILDSCVSCDEEYGSQSYRFECPYNDVE